MGRFLLRRALITIPLLIGLSLVTYGMLSVAPGDPVTALLDPEQMAALGPEWVAQRKEALGLNDPLPVRYALWLGQAARGNLGYSYRDHEPVTAKIGQRLWPTLKLMLTVQLLALLVGLPLGVLAAIRQYSVLDYVVGILGFAAVSLPSFFLGLCLIYLFSLHFRWLPTAGMNAVGRDPTLVDSLRHIVLPAAALGLAYAAPIIRHTRASVLESIHQDYVVVARAKGLSERAVTTRHVLRNGLIPLVTVVALELPSLLGGAVIIEQVFAWPGMGTLAITAVFGRDYPVIMGITLVGSLMVLASNLLADVTYAVVDPRVRVS